jgi:hypothetical protein
MNQRTRLIFAMVALVWLTANYSESKLQALSFNCSCELYAEGWKYVLVNPHCGSSYDITWSGQADAASCESWCDGEASAYGSVVCGAPCDQNSEYQASAYTYAGCFLFWDTSQGGCNGYYPGVC